MDQLPTSRVITRTQQEWGFILRMETHQYKNCQGWITVQALESEFQARGFIENLGVENIMLTKDSAREAWDQLETIRTLNNQEIAQAGRDLWKYQEEQRRQGRLVHPYVRKVKRTVPGCPTCRSQLVAREPTYAIDIEDEDDLDYEGQYDSPVDFCKRCDQYVQEHLIIQLGIWEELSTAPIWKACKTCPLREGCSLLARGENCAGEASIIHQQYQYTKMEGFELDQSTRDEWPAFIREYAPDDEGAQIQTELDDPEIAADMDKCSWGEDSHMSGGIGGSHLEG